MMETMAKQPSKKSASPKKKAKAQAEPELTLEELDRVSGGGNGGMPGLNFEKNANNGR